MGVFFVVAERWLTVVRGEGFVRGGGGGFVLGE